MPTFTAIMVLGLATAVAATPATAGGLRIAFDAQASVAFATLYPSLNQTSIEWNAFRHAYVSARFTQVVGKAGAQLLGDAAEAVTIANQDSLRRVDQYNNEKGRDIGEDNPLVDVADLMTVDENIAADIQALMEQLAMDDTDIPEEWEYDPYSLTKEALQEFFDQLGANVGDFFSGLFEPSDGNQSSPNGGAENDPPPFPPTEPPSPPNPPPSLQPHEGGQQPPGFPPHSPLVLDLDGDGIELTSLGQYGTYFDLTNDGMAELTGWVNSDDGLLAIDSNQNGRIDDADELFGTNITDGFTVLRALDSNSDGRINSADGDWSDLRVWQDENVDGMTQDGELKTLMEFNIASINLDATLLTGTQIAGNDITHTSTYTLDNGTTRTIVDAWFDFDTGITRNREDYNLDIRAAFLPTLRGYGSIKDLHIEASLDNSGTGNLMDKLIDFAADKTAEDFFSDWNATQGAVEDILLDWAGVESISPTSRGDYIDARHLAFYEAFYGRPFTQYDSPNPLSEAGAFLEAIYQYIKAYYTAQLIAQATDEELFTANPVYDLYTGKVEDGLELSSGGIDTIKDIAIASSNVADVWAQFAQFVGYTIGFDNLSPGEITLLDSAIAASGSMAVTDWDDVVAYMTDSLGAVIDDSTDWASFESSYDNRISGTSGAETINGTSGVDYISAGAGDDVVYGLSGHDRLVGGNNNDTLVGGDGDDLLEGGTGNDTYVYDSGNDTIVEASGTDKLQFSVASGLTMASIVSWYRTHENDMILNLTGEKKIVVEDQFINDDLTSTAYAMETVEFLSNSTTWAVNALNDVLTQGSAGNDVIKGYNAGNKADTIYGNAGNDFVDGLSGNDILYGGSGVDHIQGGSGNDTMDGGTQDDYLEGEAGNDTYIHSAGNDVFKDTYGTGSGTDTIQFASGLTISDLEMYCLGLDLIIKISDASTIKVIDQFAGAVGKYIETLTFAGSTFTFGSSTQVQQRGTDGNDSLNGNKGNNSINDIIYGYDGNDTVSSNTGNDLVYGGDGNDIITGYHGDDTLYGGNGDDNINGENDADTLYGEAGNDTLQGGSGNDNLYGGDHSDTLYGQNGNDVLDGGNGNDFFYGDSGNDTITGGDGNDIIYETYSGTDSINGGNGNDTLSYEGIAYKVTANLATGVATDTHGTPSNDTISNIENLTGGNGQDTLTGDANDNVIDGSNGNDALNGGAGNDTLIGGYATDTLTGGLDADTFLFNLATLGSTDTVTDFSTAQGDKLDISDILIGFDPLQDIIDDWVTLTANSGNTTVTIDRDGTGGTYSAQNIATLTAVTGLDADTMLGNGTLIAA